MREWLYAGRVGVGWCLDEVEINEGGCAKRIPVEVQWGKVTGAKA